MIVFDKNEIKESLSLEDIYSILSDFGGEPEYSSFGILCATICHNPPGEGSKKLYYYTNSHLFKCYTGCDSYFDIFELIIKIVKIQYNEEYDLNDAVRWIAKRFGISGEYIKQDKERLKDWDILTAYDRINNLEIKEQNIILKEYDRSILDKFAYNVRIIPWLREGINQTAMDQALIGFYPGGDQITIPHFDINGRFVGLRGRTLCAEEGERYGKYRPIRVGKDMMFNHPLGFNLYNLNNSKNNIAKMKKVIVFESEKSTLLYQSYFGLENDISVACCGSSLSAYQVNLLLSLGVEEIIIGFDRQFQEIGDEEFKHLKTNLLRLRERYKNYVTISFIFDKNMITGYKASPIDEGPNKFLQLFKERIVL